MKNTINCIIVDDDSFAIRLLSDHICKIPRLKLVGSYDNSIDALSDIIGRDDVDLIFLDIDMPGLSGIQLAEALRHSQPNIIFTTAFAEYALKAIELRARHYLLKPIEFSRFAETISTVLLELFDDPLEVDNSAFYLRTGERGHRIKVLKSDIIYLQGAGNYVHIFTPEYHYTIYYSLREISERLSADTDFFRVHKSYIINTKFIRSVRGNTIHLQKYDVLMTSPYKMDFMRYLEDNTLLFKKAKTCQELSPDKSQ